ncbi:MAG: polysaccharide ABC transporter ATP-binding protein [Crocinitomicaceae bacterium]|nr:polysaccharide ABC transporter ATP-binding protein [Crocinitomicaceae bacterium]
MKNDIAIKLEGVSKKYTIGKEKDGSLRGTLASLFSKKSEKQEEFWALKDVSFEVKKGDVIGIIGRNGAGKSTLLKILSQITRPTEGKIEINGRVASLLEVGTGFHPELTGRENIFLNGTILGMTRKEVQSKFDEIVAFSGIEKFIDTPVKHYSSGMYVRLAFAVAAHLEPEILIIDEVLAVGDAEFQKKCLGKMKDVAGEGRTVLFVSHDLAAVKSLCTRGVLLKDGNLKINSNVTEVIDKYIINSNAQKDYYNADINDLKYSVISIEIKNYNNEINHNFSIQEDIYIDLKLNIPLKKENYTIFINVKTIQGVSVFSIEKPILSLNHILIINKQFLTRGIYTLDVFIHIPRQYQAFSLTNVCEFDVYDSDSELSVHGDYNYGVVFGNYIWQ